MKATIIFFTLFCLIDLTFLMLGLSHLLTDNQGVAHRQFKAGGGFGIAAAFLAWYVAYAGIASTSNRYVNSFDPIGVQKSLLIALAFSLSLSSIFRGVKKPEPLGARRRTTWNQNKDILDTRSLSVGQLWYMAHLAMTDLSIRAFATHIIRSRASSQGALGPNQPVP